ncbi:MAG TPA: hypothetical protein VFA75_15100 [Nevskia sp.]|jgi:hypothetical protein|nr:hypothetical protein [Nevskia sp.]
MRKPLATLALLLALALQPALAGGWGHREQQRPPPRPPEPPRQMYAPQPMRPQNWAPQNRMSSGQAAQRAQQLNGGGRVLAVDPSDSGYRVRVLKDGEVRSVYVPGQ